MKQNIFLFGDSIVVGSGDSEKGGWGARLRDYFKVNNPDIRVYNFGVGGNTTDDLLQRFKNECEPIKPNIIIFGIGINDTKYMDDDIGKCIIAPERFQSNLNELVKQAKEIAGKIIFLGLTTVDESKTQPCFWDGDKTNIFFSNTRIESYNLKIKEISQKNGLLFIDMLGLLNSSDFEDGLHPNTGGYEKMFVRIKDFLLANGIVQW